MNNLSKAITVGKDLILKYRTSSSITLEHLNQLSTNKSRILCLYKKFYRLRNMIDDKPYNKDTYHTLIRRKFSREDFLTRRKILLGTTDILTQEQLYRRILNTLAFVHNSTVYLSSGHQTEPALFFQDLYSPKRIEKLIVLTILTMDSQKPPAIKYDRNYEWLTELNQQLEKLPADPNAKQYKAVFRNVEANQIGFRDYEMNLMRLNECYNLCL